MASDFITLDETRQLLRISKRKCSWMLQNGIIPCINTGMKTKQYKILQRDVTEYMEKHPDCADENIPHCFTADLNVSDRKILSAEEFRLWLEDYWYELPDMITQKEIEDITGYSQTAVRRWITTGYLRTVTVQGDSITSPEWLIDFMCGYGMKIVRRSVTHADILERYYQSCR